MWGVSGGKENARHPVTKDKRQSKMCGNKKHKSALIIDNGWVKKKENLDKHQKKTPFLLHNKEDFPVIQLSIVERIFVFLAKQLTKQKRNN